MPTYSFLCSKCQHCWDQYYSFNDFDLIVKPGKVKCPECSEKGNDVFHPPNINLGNTIGAQAEKNNKNLGNYGLDSKIESDKRKRIKTTKPKKDKWYGELPKKKAHEINSAKGKEKQNKINKYIREGK